MVTQSAVRKGFTLVELLVVIGIIALLMGLLMPAVNNAKQQANSAKCKAQLQDIGRSLQLYTLEYPDFYYPVGALNDKTWPGYYETLGVEKRWDTLPDKGKSLRWPVYVFSSRKWNDPQLTCPSDDFPAEEHTYILNKHLHTRRDKYIKPGNVLTRFGRSTSDIILMGEKKTLIQDYYMGSKEEQGNQGQSEFDIVEIYRHGLRLGSNYLYLDYHVEMITGKEYENTLDPWDIDLGTNNEVTPP